MRSNLNPLLLILAFNLSLLAPQSSYAFYNPSTGRWLNRDPLGEAAGRNLCCFLGNNSVTAVDSDGRYAVRPVHPSDKICGGWSVPWRFDGTVPRKGRYFLIQEITKVRRLNNCCSGKAEIHDSHFYEAMEFTTDGTSWSLGDDDSMESDFDTVAGLHLVSGEGRVFPADEDIVRAVASWGHVPEAKDLPATTTEPSWWNTRPIDAGYRLAWKNDWNCCDRRDYGNLHTSP